MTKFSKFEAARFWARLEKCRMAQETLAELNSMRAFLRERPYRAAECAEGAVPAETLRKHFRSAAFTRARRELAEERPEIRTVIFADAARGGDMSRKAERLISRRVNEIVRKFDSELRLARSAARERDEKSAGHH